MKERSFASMSVLTELVIKFPGMSGKDASATTAANAHLKADMKSGYYSKCKIAREDIIGPIHVRDAARNYRRSMTSPWGEGDLRMLPTARLMQYNNKMGEFKTDFEKKVQEIESDWPEIVDKQKVRLNKSGGSMFKASDYPAQHEIAGWFVFKVGQLPIPQVHHFAMDIQENVLDKLKEDLEKANSEKIAKCQVNMFERMIEPVAKMADICGNDKRVYESLLVNLEQSIDILSDLNVTGNVNFMQMVREVKDKLTGFSVGQIRENSHLKHQLGQEAEKMVGKMETMLGELQS